MYLKSISKKALTTLVAAIGLMVVIAPAQATLIGDSVQGKLEVNGLGTLLDVMAFVADPGIEFSITGNQNASLSLDVKSDSFDIIYDLSTLSDIGFATTWTLFDLDWATPGIITGVTLTSGISSLISNTSFTDDSITVDILNFNNTNQLEIWSFDIQTKHTNVPAPMSLALFGLGLAGISFSRRKKA